MLVRHLKLDVDHRRMAVVGGAVWKVCSCWLLMAFFVEPVSTCSSLIALQPTDPYGRPAHPMCSDQAAPVEKPRRRTPESGLHELAGSRVPHG